MVKLAAVTINSFRSAAELSRAEPAQLKRTIRDLELQIESYRNVIERQADHIRELEAGLGLEHGEKAGQSIPSSELELKLEQYADAFIELYEAQQDLISEALGISPAASGHAPGQGAGRGAEGHARPAQERQDQEADRSLPGLCGAAGALL
jgi:hypothetical protein